MKLNKENLYKILKDFPQDVIDEAIKQLMAGNLPVDFYERIKRRAKALNDFQVFLDAYFPHYFSIPSGPQQVMLVNLIQSLKDRKKRKALKFSRAIPRGFGKSTIISLCGVLWLMLRGDWKFVLLISATRNHAEGFLRKISDEVEGNELLFSDFPELNPAKDTNNTTVAWNDRHLVFWWRFCRALLKALVIKYGVYGTKSIGPMPL